MPQLGETVAEGKIVKWFKSAGDAVKPGDNLFEIETDKTSMEVPATFAGTLSDIRFKVGETAKVGAVVAVIAGEEQPQTPAQARGNAGNAPPPTPLTPAPASAQGAGRPEAPAAVHAARELGSRLRENERSNRGSFAYPNMDPFREVRTPERNYGSAQIGGVSVTPLARRLAGERAIDLSRVQGSGPHGRIVARDVDGAQPSTAMARGTGASAAQVKALFEGAEYEEVALDGMRRTIATRLIEAKQTIPHFYLTADIEIGRLTAMREEANAAAPKGAAPRTAECRTWRCRRTHRKSRPRSRAPETLPAGPPPPVPRA